MAQGLTRVKLEWKKSPFRNFREWLKGRSLELIILPGILAGIFLLPQLEKFKALAGCPFHEVTGYSCPSCGMTRAAHSLALGRPAEAFFYNPFIYLLVFFPVYRLFQRISEAALKKYPVFVNIPLMFYVLLFFSYILFGAVRILIEMKAANA